jgi:hypothetical protein
MLPTKKTTKKTDLRDFTIMLYGLPKIGKSTACARIEDALFIPTEPGLNCLQVFAVPQIESWDHFLETAAEIASSKHPYKVIIIDVFDELYRHCADHICKKRGKEHEADIGYGKGSPMIRNEVKRVIAKLTGLSTGLILVSHSADQVTEDRTGKTLIKKVPSFSSKVYGNNAAEAYHADFTGMVDAILYATIDRDKDGNQIRVVRSAPSNKHEAGDRTGLFKDGMLLSDLFKNTTGGGKK